MACVSHRTVYVDPTLPKVRGVHCGYLVFGLVAYKYHDAKWKASNLKALPPERVLFGDDVIVEANAIVVFQSGCICTTAPTTNHATITSIV